MNPSLLVAECLATLGADARAPSCAGKRCLLVSGQCGRPDTLKQIEIDHVAREIRRASMLRLLKVESPFFTLYGVITQRGNMVDAVSGPRDDKAHQQFSAALRELVADKGVSQILIDIGSPGGSVYGVCGRRRNHGGAGAKPVVAPSPAPGRLCGLLDWLRCQRFYVTLGVKLGRLAWQAHQDSAGT